MSKHVRLITRTYSTKGQHLDKVLNTSAHREIKRDARKHKVRPNDPLQGSKPKSPTKFTNLRDVYLPTSMDELPASQRLSYAEQMAYSNIFGSFASRLNHERRLNSQRRKRMFDRLSDEKSNVPDKASERSLLGDEQNYTTVFRAFSSINAHPLSLVLKPLFPDLIGYIERKLGLLLKDGRTKERGKDVNVLTGEELCACMWGLGIKAATPGKSLSYFIPSNRSQVKHSESLQAIIHDQTYIVIGMDDLSLDSLNKIAKNTDSREIAISNALIHGSVFGGGEKIQQLVLSIDTPWLLPDNISTVPSQLQEFLERLAELGLVSATRAPGDHILLSSSH